MNNPTITFVAPGKTEIIDNPVVAPAKGQALVRLAVSTVSGGTERANLLGDHSLSMSEAPAPASYPRIMGYSSAGTVEEVGEGVENLKKGDRVALFWSKYYMFNTISASNVFPVPDGIAFEDAAFLHIATFPLAAIRKCRLEIGESAVVMGMGILGQTAVRLLRAAGAAPVIAADPDENKRERAIEIGADLAFDPYAPDFAESVKRATDGGAKVGIEVTGFGAGLNGILDCMARFGRVALLGCTRNSDFSVDYYRKVHGPGITLIGVHTLARPKTESSPGMWTQRDDMKALTKLILGGRLDLKGLIQETYSYRDAVSVFDRLAVSKAFPLTQIDWRRDK